MDSSCLSQIAQHLISTDGVVTELKDEIEKVKSQLRHINLCKNERLKNASPDKSDPLKLISQLKTENKQLKKELIQKRKMQQASMKNVEKAKDIMNDYEKKVGLLHEQAIKSSKVMKQSKERFCKCLQEKDQLVKELQRNNESLQFDLREQEVKYEQIMKLHENLQESFNETNGKCIVLSGNNEKFVQCIELLEQQLQCAVCECEQYKEDVRRLEQEISDIKCNTCQKLELKLKKQKEKYENRLKQNEENENILKGQISELSRKIMDLETEKLSIDTLQCKQLEDKCKRQCETTLQKEKRYEKERDEMRQLVDELTNVVKQNKVTLLQLSNINKQQEVLLESQCSLLSEKEEKIKMGESTIEMMEIKSSELEREVEELRKILSGPCTKSTCCSLSKELEEIKTALSQERDNQLMKQKVIEDQSQTIYCLQYQIKEKMSELSKAREETSIAEEEMSRINNDLVRKHKDLERELDEKEQLLEKMKKLEYQKTLLSNEMEELERLLQRYCDSQQYDEQQQDALYNLQKQVELQRREWEAQKENLAIEKEKAVCAAKFATQKLLETVSDFQKQVETQKKVQTMLTKMLHNKEEELKIIKSKMSSINTIATDVKPDMSMKELYKRSRGFDLSNPTTTTSFYSSCSNCSRAGMKSSAEKSDLQKLFYLLTSTAEQPIEESSR
ncbi:hypothetical protein NQ314_014418 [Rhamnusium bicolor]|uniref:Uncharacterized protein n=1 Tax=Rhamnusium bicolor TaxID=1586634 RepID=A0AAV8X168_9CUCU|nr:hypothetical protein NQ314_014418 [Rhamnusium bicolor]